jgi:hypothetical protein
MVAWDPGSRAVVKNSVFLVYAPGDTSFASPLPITDPLGNALANLNSGAQGVFPAFAQAQYTTVVVSDSPNHAYAWTVPAALTTAVLQWSASTYYSAGQVVTEPGGTVVQCNANHTSTSSFNATYWTPVQANFSAALGMILGA